MPHKKKQQTNTPPKEDKPKQHAYYVCEGATCTCEGAAAPTPVPLKITSHSKFYILGGKKLIATDKDNTPQNLDFISCKNVPPNSSPQPCKAKLKIKWDKFYKDVSYDNDHKHPLLDISEGSCDGYVPKSAKKIKIANHGQIGHATQKEIQEHDNNIFTKWIPFFQSAEEPLEKQDAPTVQYINLLPDGTVVRVPVQSGAKENEVVKQEIEIQDKEVTLKFRAAVKSGDIKLVSWNQYSVKKAGDKNPSYDSLFVSFIEQGANCAVQISPKYKGVFRLEAYGFLPHDESCSLDIEFCENEVKIVTGITKGLQGKPLIFSSGFKFQQSTKHVSWKITQDRTELYNSETLNVMHGGITSILQNIQLSFANQVQFTFANKGKYTITAFDNVSKSSKSLDVEIFAMQEVLQMAHNAEQYLRETDSIKCTVQSFNVDDSLINKSTIEWRIYYGANGQRPTQYYGEIKDSKGQLSITCTPKQLQQFLRLPSVKGCYKIEVYAEHPTAQSMIGSRSHVESYTFEVKDNCVTTVPAGAPQVPVGCTANYKVETLMPVNAAEKNMFIWEVAGGNSIIESAINQTQEIKITFTENATYTIKCHMLINGINTGSKETTVVTAPLQLHSANWCYNDGYLRTQTGYDEECYAYVEMDGAETINGKLQVWLISQDLNMADVVKDNKYFLGEYDLNLTKDEHRTPATAHGYTAFKPDKTKIQSCLPDGVMPQFTFTITINEDGGGVHFGKDIVMQHATKLVANNKTYYVVLPQPQQYLNLTNEQKIKAIYFSDKEKKSMQIGRATYGETHQVRIHTTNLIKEKLTVRAYRENPNAMLDGTYEAVDKTIVIAEMMQEFKDQQPLPDGSLMLDFLLKPDWKAQHKSETLRLFVGEVFKTVKDPVTSKDILQLVQSQYNTKDNLPFNLLRNESQICIQITDKNAPADKDSLEQYKQQYINANDALFVVKDLTDNTPPQPSPTIVYFEDLEVGAKKECYCNRDFTVDEMKEMVKMLNDGKSTLWANAPQLDKKSYEDLTMQINTMFKKYGITRCMQKIMFLAEVKGETGFFQATVENKSNHASSQSFYKGRGILQLTGDKPKGANYFSEAGAYGKYATDIGNLAISTNPDIVSNSLFYSIDSGGWEWADESNGKKCPQWSPPHIKNEFEENRIWKAKYFQPALGQTLNTIALLGEKKEDEEKYFYLICKLLNGYLPKDGPKLEPPIDWGKRKAAFATLKDDFFEYDERHNGIKLDMNGRAPWITIAIQEAKKYGGKDEGTIDERIKTYHKEGGGYNGDSSVAWCASFANWCLKEAKIKIKQSPSSQSFLSSDKVEKCDVFYGAIAVFTDCNETGTSFYSTGHNTFVFGKLTNGEYCVLGGNQHDQIKVSNYDCSGNTFFSYKKGNTKIYKKFRGFYKPKGYAIKEIDKLSAADNYSTVSEANKKVMDKAIEGSTNGEKSQ